MLRATVKPGVKPVSIKGAAGGDKREAKGLEKDMPGKGLGHFFGAMRIDAFRPAEEFKAHMDNWIERFRAATPAPGYDRVLIPGDPEREMAALRSIQGIPIHEAVENDLAEIAERLGIVPL